MELNNITNTGTWGQQVTRLNDNFNRVALGIDTLQSAYQSLSQSAIEVVDTLPQTGKSNKIYRLVGTTSYSDYMYNTDDLNIPILMATYNNAIENEPTPGSNNLVKSGGVASNIVFDISAYHATGSTIATYADLAAALGSNGANVPLTVRRGGMSVKFVQSSDNKYVQWRYMGTSIANADFTNVANWQGVDDTPTVGSHNLVESVGVVDYIAFGEFLKRININKKDSTIVNAGVQVSLEQDKYYKFLLNSTENKITNAKVVFTIGQEYKTFKVDNNGFLVIKSPATVSGINIQNKETISGADTIVVSIYECNNSSDSLRIAKNSEDIDNLNSVVPYINRSFDSEAIFGKLLDSKSLTKTGSTVINQSFSRNLYASKIYAFRVETNEKKVTTATFAYNLNGNYISVPVNAQGVAVFRVKADIQNYIIQNEETITGTDIMICKLYEVTINSLISDYGTLNGCFLKQSTTTKTGSTDLNFAFTESISTEKVYIINVKTLDNKLSYVNIVLSLGSSEYQTDTIPIINNYGSIFYRPKASVSVFNVQNRETIDGTEKVVIELRDVTNTFVNNFYNQIDQLNLKDRNYNFNDSYVTTWKMSKVGSTTLNNGYLYNFVNGESYKFYVKTSGIISYVGIVFQKNDGTYVSNKVYTANSHGVIVITCEQNYSQVWIQNRETITGTDNISIDLFLEEGSGIDKRIELYKAEQDLKIEQINPFKLYRTIIGDYTVYNIKHVGVGYEYSNPMDAIVSISDASPLNRYLVMLHDDINITQISDLRDSAGNHCSNSIVEEGTTNTWAFIYTKDYVDIIGANKSIKIKVELPLINQNQKYYLHCIYSAGNVKIANIDLDSKNTRYCMHLENGSGSSYGEDANAVIEYKNMNMLNRNDSSFGFNYCLGIGTAPNSNVTIENCNCISLHDSAISGGHSHSNYAYPFRFLIKNSTFSSMDGNFNEVHYSDIFSGVKQSFVIEGTDLPSWGCKRGSYGFPLTLTDKAHDYRNGGIYLSGHGNNFVMIREEAPCLTFETSNNNASISAVQTDIVGDCLLSYSGTPDAHGIFVGTELIKSGNGSNVLSLGSRLGDCSTVNKTLIVTIDNVEQTVTFNRDYSNMNDSSILSEINSALSGCICYIGYDIEIPFFSDEVCYAKNTGESTINIGDLLTLDINNGYNCYKKCSSGDNVDAIASRRMNPNDFAFVIKKGHQKFRNIGGQNIFTIGKLYGADNNGGIKVVTDESLAAFKCIGQNVLIWTT